MTASNDLSWEDTLHDACFPVKLDHVYIGHPPRRAKRYRAIVPDHGEVVGDPFAIVTNRYRLIRNEDVVDLGHEAFERIFGSFCRTRMTVFNVVMAKGRGSFFADFTTPDLDFSIPIPGSGGVTSQPGEDLTRHTFFLRTVNSYNKTQAVRLEAGMCRWICRNGMIFGKQSIRFHDPHYKTKHQLMDEIAKCAEPLRVDALPGRITNAYGISLPQSMTVLEGAYQTLRLAIPPVDPKSRTARLWKDRCAMLIAVSEEYAKYYGKTAFSALQAASQWSRDQSRNSPIQRHGYERRCGEMLELLAADGRWPSQDRNAQEQINRVLDWSIV